MPAFREYIGDIEKALLKGNATEHTHRPALKGLVESLDKKLTATNEPKQCDAGAPDFIVSHGQIPLGYIEAKDVGKNLAKLESGEQILRYRHGLTNLIFTDYLEFRWYRNGELAMTTRLATEGKGGKLVIDEGGAQKTAELFHAFLTAKAVTVNSPRELAQRMAGIGQLLRSAISLAMERESKKSGTLHSQMEGFRKNLLHDLSEAQFADMYAQTVCYGLFTARIHHKKEKGRFTREHAPYELPSTNPFLKKLFIHIAGPDMAESVVWAVDNLTELLEATDIGAVLRGFGDDTKRTDPVVHFYETFLAAYDPKMREMRGVYYTPEPVVSYIVRSVDAILKRDFGLGEGWPTHRK